MASALGCRTRSGRVLAVAVQTVDMAMTAAANALQEVGVYAKGGDPAYRILREVVRQSDQFNTSLLPAYRYESYAKVEACINNFAPKATNRS